MEMTSFHVGSPADLLAECHRSAFGHPLTRMLELLPPGHGEINLSLSNSSLEHRASNSDTSRSWRNDPLLMSGKRSQQGLLTQII